ncbi:MAG TPA: hypothetical protein VER11_31740 [Polyangiaceae bacterium]|nr:hypothetical protein [Polyangiaceae bacterium]
MRTRIRSRASKVFSGVCLSGCLLAVKGCALSFEDYPEGDLCAASADAGFHPSTAPDPALRGCDAGPPGTEPNQELAGAAGMDGAK